MHAQHFGTTATLDKEQCIASMVSFTQDGATRKILYVA